MTIFRRPYANGQELFYRSRSGHYIYKGKVKDAYYMSSRGWTVCITPTHEYNNGRLEPCSGTIVVHRKPAEVHGTLAEVLAVVNA